MMLPDGKLPSINNATKVYVKCPVCKGKGYCEQIINPLAFHEVMPSLQHRNANSLYVNGQLKPETYSRRNTISNTGEPLKLPIIVREPRKSLPKVQLKGHSVLPLDKRMEETVSDKHQNNVFGNLVFPRIQSSNSTSTGNITPVTEENSPSTKKDLLPQPKEIENPQETMKIAINNLKQSHWQIVLQAVHDIVQLSRYNPALVEPHMPVITRCFCQLLQSLRSQVTRTACQALREMFRTMQSTQRPESPNLQGKQPLEFDEVVSCLLQRTADMNRFIRQDSNEALDSMVMYIPTYHAVRALIDKGVSHKNPLVRTATARLLTCAIMISGSETVLSPTANKGTRREVIQAAVTLLGDGNLETRIFAKKLIKFLMRHEAFDSVFYNTVDSNTIAKIQKTLTSLRSQVKKESPHIRNSNMLV